MDEVHCSISISECWYFSNGILETVRLRAKAFLALRDYLGRAALTEYCISLRRYLFRLESTHSEWPEIRASLEKTSARSSHRKARGGARASDWSTMSHAPSRAAIGNQSRAPIVEGGRGYKLLPARLSISPRIVQSELSRTTREAEGRDIAPLPPRLESIDE